jgi:hypothetical protein
MFVEMTSTVIIGQAGELSTSALIQYGALGIIAALALAAVRVLFQREVNAHDLERQRADRLEEELRRLNTTVQDRYVTTLGDATKVMSEVLDYLRREDRR